MNKEELKNKLRENIDYHFGELDPEPPPLFIILDALRELRNEIIEEHIELFDQKDPFLYDLSTFSFKD